MTKKTSNEGLSDDDLETLLKPLWVKTKPSREAQAIRSELSVSIDDPRCTQWPL